MEKPGDLILQSVYYNKMKQWQFAEELGISKSMLNELISGRTKLSIYTAMRIEKNFPDFDSREAIRRQVEITYRERIGVLELA